jgi:hypothetical protein
VYACSTEVMSSASRALLACGTGCAVDAVPADWVPDCGTEAAKQEVEIDAASSRQTGVLKGDIRTMGKSNSGQL